MTPIYAGTYQETLVKALTAHKSGTPPVTSVLLSTDMFTLIDEDAIVPIDNFVKTADDKAWLAGFYPAFMMNSRTGGKTWGVPFQRSTVVMYYNKDLFDKAGVAYPTNDMTLAQLDETARAVTSGFGADKVYGTHSSEKNPKLCAGCHLTTHEVTDKATGAFVMRSTGHAFDAIPCVDANGKPTGEASCTMTARSFKACTTSGCQRPTSAIVRPAVSGVPVFTKKRMFSFSEPWNVRLSIT